ncbi:hypothetical protein OH77DRAFT_1525306 [Trametes cingulata]|nr:hypothetical protein OH77DRAFT_1525306 [Trametes cingulata]
MHPSVYDILGVVFGAVSVFGIFRYLHRWVKNRQPPSCLRKLNAAVSEVQSLLTQLEHPLYSNPSRDTSAVDLCRDELRRIHRRSLSLSYAVDRWSAEAGFVAQWKDAIRCPLADDILALRQEALQLKSRLLLLCMEAPDDASTVVGYPPSSGRTRTVSPDQRQPSSPSSSLYPAPLAGTPAPASPCVPSPPSRPHAYTGSSSPSLPAPPSPRTPQPNVLPKGPPEPDRPTSWNSHAHPQDIPQHGTRDIPTSTAIQTHVQERNVAQRRPAREDDPDWLATLNAYFEDGASAVLVPVSYVRRPSS